jgi:hypothetical protein
MNPPLVRMVQINGLQFNANRDPQAYRRPVGTPFHIRVLLAGSGEAHCILRAVDGRLLAESTERLPGSFRSELRFDTPGSRVVTLAVSSGDTHYRQDLRLDVEPAPH